MKLKHQILFLNAVSTDLSLLNKMGHYVYRPAANDFSGENKVWFELLVEAKEKGFDKINEETIKILKEKDITIKSTKDAKTDFLNAMEAFKKFKSRQQTEHTVNEINKKINELNNIKDVNKTEAIIKEMSDIIRDYRYAEIERKGGEIKDLHTMYAREESNIEVVPAYLEKLDEQLGGGFSRGGISIIGAFPGVGKTSLAVQCATMQAVNKHKVLFLSLEQSFEDISSQSHSVLTTLSRIPFESGKRSIIDKKIIMNRNYWSLRRQDLTEKEKKERERESKMITEELVKGMLDIESSRYSTLDEVIERILFAVDQGVEIVYIDNFQNAPKDPKFRKEVEAYNYLADKLEEISVDFNIAIVLLSQITVRSDGEVTSKYSDRAKQNAQNFIVLENPEPEDSGDPSTSEIKFKMEKTRFSGGNDREFKLAFQASKGIIGSVERPEWLLEESDKEKKKSDEFFDLDDLPF